MSVSNIRREKRVTHFHVCDYPNCFGQVSCTRPMADPGYEWDVPVVRLHEPLCPKNAWHGFMRRVTIPRDMF